MISPFSFVHVVVRFRDHSVLNDTWCILQPDAKVRLEILRLVYISRV